MARHASTDQRRRLAAWPIVVTVAVLLLSGLTVGYFAILNHSKKVAACTGETVLPVTASPGAARAVADAAAAFNSTGPVARSSCVSVSVTITPGGLAASALAGGWKGRPEPAPGLWVVDSAADVASLDADNPAMTAGHGNASLATSPVVLAVRVAPATGVVTWKTLAGGGTGQPVLAMPDPAVNRATAYALQSMIAASPTDGSVADESGKSVVARAAPMFARLAAAVPSSPSTTAASLAELAGGRGGFTAVPVVESELVAFNAVNSVDLSAVHPAGATAGDQVMAIPLTAVWVTDAMSDAAAAFDAFLGDAKGVAIFDAADLRTPASPAAGAGVDSTTAVTSLPIVSADDRAAIRSAWASARPTGPSSPATTPEVVTTPDPPTSTTS